VVRLDSLAATPDRLSCPFGRIEVLVDEEDRSTCLMQGGANTSADPEGAAGDQARQALQVERRSYSHHAKD
jgi:hypothetical protein